MAQKLILPINKATITASYKNPNYKTQFKYTHFGIDLIGNITLYASGNGVVTHCGPDSLFGNVIVIVYDTAIVQGQEMPITARYFHLASIGVKVGQRVSKDTVLGYMGKTGKLVTGVHLHLEFDKDVKYPNFSPTGNGTIIKGGTDTTINPVSVLFVKTTAPDSQSITGQSYNNCVNTGEAESIQRIVEVPQPIADPKDTIINQLQSEVNRLKPFESLYISANQKNIDLANENAQLKAKITNALNILK